MKKSLLLKKLFYILTPFIFLIFQANLMYSQKLDYECYQIGNDYPGNPVFVPHNVADIFVLPDGTVYTNVSWEENGANVSEVNPDGTITRRTSVGNHGGGEAVTANDSHIYFAGDNHRTGNEGIDRRDRSTLSEDSNVHVDCGEKVYGLVLTSDKVYASVRELNIIKVFDLNLQPLADLDITTDKPEDLFFDSEGKLWVLKPASNKVVRIDPATKNILDEIVFEASVKPEDIAIDNQNRLYVADAGIKQQIHIYKDITTAPVFVKSFGHEGGILSGTPGLYKPLKFDTPVGVGVDRDGNIVVANRQGNEDGSTIIQKYTPSGELLWDVMCVVWIDMMQPIPGNENMVYTSRERMSIDYANQDWELEATTIDKYQYPDDYRLTGDNHTGATWIRNLYGENFMFLTNMPGTRVDIYKFNGEITIPIGYVSEDRFWFDVNGDGQVNSGEIKSNSTGSTRGFWVDINGTIWQASRDNGIFKYSLEGVDANGAAKYSLDSKEKFPMPEPFTELRRIRFYPERNNLMVLNGFTEGALANINHHWKRAGKVFRGYENWNGQFGAPDWEMIPPFEDVEGGNGGDGNIQSFEIVDDYIFFAREGSSPDMGIARGTVEVYELDGPKVGYMTPTDEMGHIGILDITEAMVVYKLSWGPYIIGIEDDGKSKIVVYKWCPEGDCIPSSMEIHLNDFPEDTLFTYNNVQIESVVFADTSTIEKVEYYAGNLLLGTVTVDPYTFTLPDTSLGNVAIRAKVVADNGAYKWSNEIFATISNGSPMVNMTAPAPGEEFNLLDTILISATGMDFDGIIDSVEFYSGSGYLKTVTTSPFETELVLTTAGKNSLYAIAYDDDANSAQSEAVNYMVFGYRQADNPGKIGPGLIREYYEGGWAMLPDFSQLISKKKDTAVNFDIGFADDTDQFAFLFSGYINIREKGKYTFYTKSDDGSQLFIGDRLIVDNDGTHGPTEKGGAILLDTGLHKIQVSMFEYQGGEELSVKYEGPSLSKQLIPDTVLYRSLGSAPLITITNPSKDTLINMRDIVYFKTSVLDEDNDVSNIEIYTGDYLLGQFTDTAYVLEINNLAEGIHAITARAYDLGGAVSVSDTLYITVNGPPEVNILSPENQSEYTRSESILIEFNVEDENLKKAEILVNNKLTKTFTSGPFQYELNNLEIGNYFISIVATDDLDLETSTRVEVRVINSVPSISIIEPIESDTFEYGEQIVFKASLTDTDEDVYKVAFYHEGEQLGEDANFLHQTTVRNLPVGEYSVVAKAFDRAGAMGESDTLHISVIHPVSVKDNELLNVGVFPNPLRSGELSIRLQSNVSGEDIQLSICDISGREIYADTFTGQEAGVDLPYEIFREGGMYFLRLKSGSDVEVYKLLVE